MRYDEFRDALTRHLQEAQVRFMGPPRERLDLTTTTRSYELFIEARAHERVDPFQIAASVGFDWDPFESARSYTTEDDLLTEILGRDDDLMDTMPRSLRVDFVLKSNLPWGTVAPLPGAKRWRAWCRSVVEALDPFLPTDAAEHLGRPIIVTGWGGTVTIEAESSVSGDVSLRAVSLPTWRSVVLPRLRDAVDEEPDADVGPQLEDLTRRYRHALDTWASSIAELRQSLDIRPRET